MRTTWPSTSSLVRRLVASSFPECAELTLTPLAASGSSNAMFRLGDELLVRLPRQPGGSASIEKEALWLPTISAALSTPVPEVVGLGAADHGYPETWSVVRWIDGRPPVAPWDPGASGPSRGVALDLARVITEMRGIEVPPAARADPDLEWYRSGPLAEIDEDFRPWVAACRELPGVDLDLDRALTLWELALAAETSHEPGCGWVHGDLFAENLLVREGRLAAVLDADGRDVFWAAVEVDEGTRLRSMGWALAIG